MALETATYIDGLVTTNPTGLDPKSQGDDHIRLLKSTIKATLPNITGAVTASQAELNILDGATLSTAELNVLDGVTATAAEINHVSGVTSPIQGQLDAKQPADADLTALAGLTTTGLIVRTGVGASAARTLTAGAGVTIVNGDGVAGNPTIGVTPGFGSGDVLGSASSVDGHGVVFDGATGKLIKSLGAPPVAKSGDTMTGPLAQAAGSAALPSYTFSDDTNTGMWSPAADTLAWSTAGSERLRIDTNGNVRVTGSGGLGYGVGSGGTATQATSKSTAVTLNKPSGTITMNNALLGAGASVIFQVNNSLLSTPDSILLTCPFISVNPNNYRVEVAYSSNGSFNIRVTNITAGALSEALQINFTVIKGAAS